MINKLENIEVVEKLQVIMADHCGYENGIMIGNLFKEIYSTDGRELLEEPYYLEHFVNKILKAIKFCNAKKLTFIRKRNKLYFNLKTEEDAEYNERLMLRMIKNAKANIQEGYDYVRENKYKELQLKRRKKILVPA